MAITPVEQAAAAPPAGSAGANAAAAGAVTVPSGIYYPDVMKRSGQGRQKSLSEMANEQLNGGGQRRNRLGEGVSAAELPDCIRPGGSLLSALTIPIEAATGKCK
jgi:hypothetical protein